MGSNFADLPSYQDATARPDWLELVAPWLPLRDYPRLCLVSRRFYGQFAPRLWNDPLGMVCRIHPDCDHVWLSRFVKRCPHFTVATRSGLVRSFDTRNFFPCIDDGVSRYTGASGAASFPDVLSSIAHIFPRLRCVLLDGDAYAVPLPWARKVPLEEIPSFEPPMLLSLARSHGVLPTSFLSSPYLKSLLYLDISSMPGSLKYALSQGVLSPANLPSLRVLKARGREMDNYTATLLFKAFWEQMWSVDLSGNRLTDEILDTMHQFSFPSETSRADHSAVEGKLSFSPNGTPLFGQFCVIQESDWSGTFSHPHRHVADAPSYTVRAEDGAHSIATPRLNGRVKIRLDSADSIKALVSGSVGSHTPRLDSVKSLDICRGHQGITHLHLNGNNISAAGLARIIRSSPGQLQRLECDSMSFKLPEGAPPSWLSKASMSGTLGWAHTFRPVFSSNLQMLRIHHSFVTRVLSLELEGVPPLAAAWLAETQLLPRADIAYPEVFVPDMNPRIQSLVLTRIPRCSTGPLIERLIAFLKLASVQERAIQDIGSDSRHAPMTLLGLRHIRLEFEPDFRDELQSVSDLVKVDFDAAVRMEDDSNGFSFFGNSGWSSSPSAVAGPSRPTQTAENAVPSPPDLHNTPETQPTTETGLEPEPEVVPEPSDLPQPAEVSLPRPPSYYAEATIPTATRTNQPLPHSPHEKHTWSWNGNRQSTQVWVGPSITAIQGASNHHDISLKPAIREYAWLLHTHPHLHRDPVPASPCHISAGVPPGELVFSAAWESILCPPGTSLKDPSTPNTNKMPSRPTPTRAQLVGMQDVLAEIKAYRRETKAASERARREARVAGKQDGELKLGAPHFHWSGKLEVEIHGGGYASGRYWR
ncbi:hypothetical protein B0J18DRAFT_430348 [Chaetomium sp. MPI-SDFR-AT-0129]|nr:hypothetical protein B0J18DRAFT_430348 [Chaetomium sp. MPI-SDFR-AT-0129]